MYDSEKLVQQMGQYEAWCGKLFVYWNKTLGWRFVKNL